MHLPVGIVARQVRHPGERVGRRVKQLRAGSIVNELVAGSNSSAFASAPVAFAPPAIGIGPRVAIAFMLERASGVGHRRDADVAEAMARIEPARIAKAVVPKDPDLARDPRPTLADAGAPARRQARTGRSGPMNPVGAASESLRRKNSHSPRSARE
jgi:hypothetical protein